MMKNLIGIFTCLATLLVPSVYAADAPGELSGAQFIKQVALPKGSQRLIGGAADRLYFATKEGAVAETDLDGKVLKLLQAKESADPVLQQPQSLVISREVIYIADSESKQIAMFNAAGKYLGSFGGKKGGLFGSAGEHELKVPRAVAVYEGVVYVLDREAKKVLSFGSNGVYLGTLELKLARGAKPAKDQGEVYKLRDPIDLKVDESGRLYVLDGEDSLIKSYSQNGEFLHALPWDGDLVAFAVTQDGIFATKNNDHTVQKYDFNDKLISRFGGGGEAKGQFKVLAGIAAVKDRQVVVADTGKNVFNIFVADAGQPLEIIPRSDSKIFAQSAGDIPLAFNKMAWNGKDTLYGIDADQKEVAIVANGKVSGKIQIKGVSPLAVAIDKAQGIWLLDKQYRVIKVDASGKILASFGSEGSGNGQFDDPTDMVISSSGKFFVADKGNDSVQIFSAEGTFISAIRKLDNPVAITVDSQDNLYVLGKGNDFISIYSAKGELLRNFGNEKREFPGKLQKPVALLAVQDELFVIDGGSIKVFSPQGEYLRSFAAQGKGAGELDEPITLAIKDDVTVLISELGNRRIQSFVTQYKPVAPKNVVATGALHSIELAWDTLDLPYVSQYQVYRSKEAKGGFVRVGNSRNGNFVDRGLEPDGKYFYRVAAETRFGYEGAASVLVNGVAKKYIPPVLDAVKVEATAWQLKLSWKPVESEYLSSYIIYQKEGNNFIKVGEALTPEFMKEGLTPNTKYTYYIAAHSSDGTDAEKFAVTASTLAFSKAPLEIEVLNLRPIFSNTYKLYEEDGVGTVKLTNNTEKVMEGVTLSFMLKDIMDFATESKLEKLEPGKSAEVKLKAVFNNNILNVTEDTSVQTMLEASYFDNGKRESYSKNSTVSLYEKHKLLWDERERYASFITPKDPPIISFVRSVVTQYKDIKDESQLAAALFNALGVYGVTYIPDPTNPYQVTSGKTNMVDYIQFPRETLERKSGDCDDLVAFYVSSLESMGIATRVIEVPGHMFMMFATGVRADDSAYTMDDMYVIYEGTLWIPVETTVMGSSFVKAWELGAANYYKWKDKGLTLLDIQHAWQTYKPASLAESKWKPNEVSKESIDKKFPTEIGAMLKISSQTKTRHYRQHIEKNPNDVDAHLQIGIVLAKMGDSQEALKYFDKVISLQPDNAAALNNRGNIFMIEDKYAEAQKSYREAAAANPDDPYIWINLAKAYKASNQSKEAKEAFTKAQSLDPNMKKKYKALGLELSNTM